MKIAFKIYQLERLGQKQKKWIVRKEEKFSRIEISSKVFGPTTLENCKNFLKRTKK